VGSLTVVFLTAAASLASSLPVKRATICNGHAELCSRSFGNTTFFGAHDSYAFSSDPLALARDQEVNISTQLGLGVRLLQAQAHESDGELHFCHTSCALFDGGLVVDYLTTVKTFLDANPNEVITFIFTNPEGLSIPDVWAPAFVNSGISDIAYVPPSLPVAQSDWPTLGEMIDNGTRVVVFLDAGADGSDGGTVPYILPEFPMIWEDPFDSTDSTFPCSVNRTAGPLSTADHMYMINHFLDVDILSILLPDLTAASKTNGVSSILANANGCAPLSGANRWPNFVLLDWVNIGDGMQAVNILNGVS